MSTGSLSSQLGRTVERFLSSGRIVMFARYWEMNERSASIADVRRFFVRTETRILGGGYGNAAIIGDGLLVDVEGDDADRSGRLTVYSLDAFDQVFIHAGPLPGLPSSQGARLVVVAEMKGQEDAGTHWVAKTPEEEDRLLEFAEELIGAISRREDR